MLTATRRQGQTVLEAHYLRALGTRSAIAPHLPRLRQLASGLDAVVEFGVKRAASSSAFLLGAEQVVSYDLVATPEAQALALAVGPRWQYRIQDSRTAPVEPCELLFIDSRHTFDQCDAELGRHAEAVLRWIVFHDSITFGSVGADGESGLPMWAPTGPGQVVPPHCLGIRPAIDALMVRDRTWHLAEHHLVSHGLLILERRPCG